MCARRVVFVPVAVLLLALVLPAQEPSAPSPASPAPSSNGQTSTILPQVLATLTGGVPITDATLTGTAIVASNPGPSGSNVPQSANPSTQSGTITLTAVGGEKSQVTTTLPSGVETSIRSVSGVPTQTYSAPGVASQASPGASALTPHPSWFLPALLVSDVLSSSSNYVAKDLGKETLNGTTVEHIEVYLQPSGSAATSGSGVEQLTRTELYIDPNTFLPVELTTKLHSFNPANPTQAILSGNSNVLEQVVYSSYQTVAGRPVACHLQVYLTPNAGQNILLSDIQISSAVFNTGATIAAN